MNLRASLLGLMGLTLAGCSHDMTDLEQYVAEIKARPPGPIERLPEIKRIDAFFYDQQDERGVRRDPFLLKQDAAITGTDVPTNGVTPKDHSPQELEQFPLDSVSMVGTLDQDDIRWGLLTIRDGTLFRVRTGNYVGRNNGQITRIMDDRIELTEIVSDGTGGWIERQASIALSE